MCSTFLYVFSLMVSSLCLLVLLYILNKSLYLYIYDAGLIHLAQIFELGAGRTLASWDVPLV